MLCMFILSLQLLEQFFSFRFDWREKANAFHANLKTINYYDEYVRFCPSCILPGHLMTGLCEISDCKKLQQDHTGKHEKSYVKVD